MSLHHDLLAELELTMVPSLRTRPEPGMYVPASEPPEAASRSRSRRRSFWCALKEQEVEVEFETKAFLGFPRLVGVKRCSVFDDPEKVACGRHCLDSKFRRQWPPALPIADHRRALGASRRAPLASVIGEAAAEERVIYIAAVEPKGGTTVDKEPYPARELPKGPGYVRKAPDGTGRWEVSVSQWSPATVVVRQGDRVALEFVGINGAVHVAHVDKYHPEHFAVTRGEVTRIQFTADTPGIFKIHCRNHEPSMEGYLVAVPK